MTDGFLAEGERLNKRLARAGIASRRGCEAIIREGRVKINGETVTELGRRVLPGEMIAVDGCPLKGIDRAVYIKLYKPRGVLTTVNDPFGRKTVMESIRDISERVFPVGRLDQESEGLLLFTNDGETAYRLTHPRFEIPKTYRVYVSGAINPEKLNRLKEGITRNETSYRIESWVIRPRMGDCSVIDVVLREGKKHEVRILFDSLNHPVLRLIRTAMGSVCLDRSLLPGQWRYLTEKERTAITSLGKDSAES